MELIFQDYKLEEELLDFSIHHNTFNGITGKDKDKIMEIITLNHSYKGTIIINNHEINRKDINSYKRRIQVIRDDNSLNYYQKTIYDLMKYEIIRRKITIRNEEKKILDSLKIVGLNPNILNQNIQTLSSSEKKFLQLSLALLSLSKLYIILFNSEEVVLLLLLFIKLFLLS